MTETLSASQAAALFDILTHHGTYREIRDFRFQGSLEHYGPPFNAISGRPSTAPALQSLVIRFLLTLPGLNNLHDDWWKVRVRSIIENFEKSTLSESYDKGVVGSRKTLATAASALIEYPVRGTHGGFAEVQHADPIYDPTKAEDLGRAFRDFMNETIYGNALEEMVEKTAQTDQLDDHTPLTKAVHEFVLVNLASFMHYTLILSPKGQYLVKLMDNANKLVPWLVVKQTMKIGNVASMINAMVRIGLAKMSVTSVTNWIGLTSNKDDGLNLLQHIISTVLSWDIKDLESRASKLEKERAQLGKDQFVKLKAYPARPAAEQEQIRTHSQSDSISIVAAILQDAGLEWRLTETHHTHALEYLSIQLSIRDRKEIINVLCHSRPDHFTEAVREVVHAYEPVIRRMHSAVDLSSTVGDLERFLHDMIKLSKVNADRYGNTSVPTVGDFIMLLRKHQFSSHTFMHQCCKNGPELTSWYLDWAKAAASNFQRQSATQDPEDHTGAGDFSPFLLSLFHSLSNEEQTYILPILDAQTAYLDSMHASSLSRLQSVLTSPPSKNPTIAKLLSNNAHSRLSSRSPSRNTSLPPSRTTSPTRNTNTAPSPTYKDQDTPTPHISSDPGPGAFLARWQNLLDNTPITPHTELGKPEKASASSIVNASAQDVDGQALVRFDETEVRGEKIVVDGGKRPDVKGIVELLGHGFKTLLGEGSCYW